MSYVIYDLASTKLKDKAYKTHAAAKAQLTRMSKQWFDWDYTPYYPTVDRDRDPLFTMGIAEINYYYANIERTVTRKNMMSGKEYTESVNTPLACSPASETYWSM